MKARLPPHDADELMLRAMVYRRHVGADLGDIRAYLTFREAEQVSPQDDAAALDRLAATGQLIRVGRRWFLAPERYRRARGKSLPPTWQQEDAWILLALWGNCDSDRCRLEHIIAVADYINHATPTLEEMHGALNRLAAARLIKRRGEAYALTPRARDLVSRLPAECNRAVLRQLDCLRRVLDCPCCGVPLKSVRWRIALDSASYRESVAAYMERIRDR